MPNNLTNSLNIHDNKDNTNNEDKFINYCIFGYLGGIIKLHQEGFNIHYEDDEGLVCASLNGHLDIVKYLVSNGANVTTGKNHSFRAACCNNRLDIMEYLLSKGADIHDNRDEGFIDIIKSSDIVCIYFFIKNGCNIHLIKEYGDEFMLKWYHSYILNKSLEASLVEKKDNILQSKI